MSPQGTVVKVVEVPPGPPVIATLLAEVYGDDPEMRRAVAIKLRDIFRQVPFIVDDDVTSRDRAPRVRLTIDQDNIEFHKVEERDVYDTIKSYLGGVPVGYSHKGGGRHPVEIAVQLPKNRPRNHATDSHDAGAGQRIAWRALGCRTRRCRES